MNEFNIYFDIDLEVEGIPDSVRKEVYARDNNRCQISGLTDNLSIHHIRLKSRGGANEAHNLILVNRSVHDWIHHSHIPSDLYVPKGYYILARINLVRDFARIDFPPPNFKTAYDFVRAMYDAIDKNDPNPPNPRK